MSSKLIIGFSSCPNDTFIFNALVNKYIKPFKHELEVCIADVEKLNKMALAGEPDICKISFHLYSYISDKYQILNSGSALGFNNGPLLVSRHKIYPDEIDSISIAIPGKYTTANLLLSIAYPGAKNKKEILFSDIEDVVLSGEVDAGLLIHEKRFTYERKGLKKIIDLGEFWQNKTNSPIPLGCIIVRRNLDDNLKKEIDIALYESVKSAMESPLNAYPFVKNYVQEMDEEVIKSHINLYVNEFTLQLGNEGKKAINNLFKVAADLKLIPEVENAFLTPMN